MKTINTIKGIVLGAILFGIFADFARNAYGMWIVSIAFFILTILFFSMPFLSKKIKELKKQSKYYIFENISLGLLSLAIFFKLQYYPGGSILILLSSALVVIYMLILIVGFLKEKVYSVFSKIVVLLFYFSIQLGMIFFLFYRQHWDAQGSFLIFYLSQILFFSVMFITDYFFVAKNKTQILNIFKEKITTNVRILFFVFFLISVYAISSKVHLQPQFFSNETPKEYQNLRKQYSSAKKEEQESIENKIHFYLDTYLTFLGNRKNKD